MTIDVLPKNPQKDTNLFSLEKISFTDIFPLHL